MKTFLSFLAFILILTHSNGQITNSVYLDYSSMWHYYSSGWNGVYSFEQFTTTYIDGDTSVNGQDYYKQYRHVRNVTNSTETNTLYGPGLVREDASNNFVYYSSGSESLFLDNATIAAVNVGDPFPAIGANCNVESTTYRSIGSQTIKHLYGAVNLPEAGIAEGIGYIGPTCALGVEGNEILVCYYRSGDSVCFANGFDAADFPVPQFMSLGNEELSNSDIAVYPNPASAELVIDPLKEAGTINWLCYNATGKLMANGAAEEHTIVDVSSWSPGMYFLHLLNGEGTGTVRKIAIE